MKPQYILLICFALFITGLADTLEAGISGLGVAPTTIPIIGTVIAAGTGPAAIALGLAVAWCINITMGTGLLVLLAYNGMMGPAYWRYLMPGFIAETVPGINVLPFWAALVVLCIMKKSKEDAGSVLGTLGKVAAVTSLVGGNPSTALGAKKTLAALPKARKSINPNLRLANDSSAKDKQREPLNLKSPGVNTDIRYAPKTA